MKKRYLLCLAILMVSALTIFNGCGSSDQKILAKVGDYDITAHEYSDYYQNIKRTYANAQDEFNDKRDLLDSMVIKRMLVQAAYENGIDKLEEISRVVLANRDRFLLDVLYQRRIVDRAEVTEAEVKDYYNHLEYKVRASHILVADLDTAQALVERIMAGENFEQLAFDYSLDPSAKRNRGDLGYFTWGTMVPEFQEAVFNMEPGQVSPPILTDFGYHIIKLVDKQPNDLRGDYKTMKDNLENQLKGRKIGLLMEEYFAELKDKYNIQIEQATCDYIMHKRENLYPPQVLQNLPRYDFDVEQLDRSERELVLATWEGGQMTLFEYLNQIKQYPVNVRPDLDNVDSLRTLVFILKSTDILSYEANAMGIDNDDEFKRKIKLFKEFNMAAVMRSDSIPVPEPPDEVALRQYYVEHPEDFVEPPRVHVYEILLSDELLARKLAKEIKSLAKFKEKAMELTERSGKRGSNGDLGVIERKWFPEIFDLARKTPVGKIGGPVVTQGKYSIFYVADKVEEKKKEFLDVKADINNIIIDQQKKEAFSNWVEEREKTTKVEIFDDVLWGLIDANKYVAADTAGQSGR